MLRMLSGRPKNVSDAFFNWDKINGVKYLNSFFFSFLFLYPGVEHNTAQFFKKLERDQWFPGYTLLANYVLPVISIN